MAEIKKQHASIVLLVLLKKDSPLSSGGIVSMLESRIVLVYEPTKPNPVYFKLPGGGEDPVDCGDPKKTAVREIEEETGVRITEDELFLLYKEDKMSHDRYFFIAVVDYELAKKSLKKFGDEDEVVLLVSITAVDDVLSHPEHIGIINLPEVRKKLQKVLFEHL